MNRNDAKLYILEHSKDLLVQDKSKKGFICPICGSGSGKKGTGITSKDNIHFTCWTGCFTSEDIFDIIGREYQLTDFNSKLEKAADLLGITIESETQNKIDKINNNSENESETVEHDYTDFFLQAQRHISETNYHRGLSMDTISRFGLGFVSEWRHPKAPKSKTSPRLIIPTSKYSYLARDTRKNLTEAQKKYSKVKVGKVRIFNSSVLKDAKKPIFVVEGELDALSIIDVGGEALALGSIANIKALLAMLETQKPTQPLIIAMDNDEAGIKANNELIIALKRLRIRFYRLNILNQYKDANEALNANKDVFRATIEQAENIESEMLEVEREQLKKEAAAYTLPEFIKNITENKKANFIPTGFSSLDKLLDGGLYAGLYIVGAISSLGKTTFCLQIADYVAQSGQDVLIFSLEMARDELIAKSISRLTLIEDLKKNACISHAKTTRGILTGARYINYSPLEKELIRSSMAVYDGYAKNIYITEGNGDVSIEVIRDKVERHVRLTGRAPVVVIDYLQIISPLDIRATDKQNTDKAVLELKRLSRDYSIPVIGISSFNRDSYNSPVNLSSFKESGAIEYSSDVLIGLQYAGMEYQEGETDKVRDKRLRELLKSVISDGSKGKPQRIQIKVLKNRNGSKGDTFLEFYPMFNYFTLSSGGIEVDSPEGWSIEVNNSEGWRKSSSFFRLT